MGYSNLNKSEISKMDDDKDNGANWTFPAEILPRNTKTDEILKKRAEEEEIKR